jgi:hypothetical protein
MIGDLTDDRLPQLCEVEWHGLPVDVVSAEGIAEAGFPAEYPENVDKLVTQQRGFEWHEAGAEGVVCRSMSLVREGVADWSGDHQAWSELAIFVEKCFAKPVLVRRRADLEWLLPDSYN